RTSGNSRATISGEPSLDALSTTTVSTRSAPASWRHERRHAASISRVWYDTMTMETSDRREPRSPPLSPPPSPPLALVPSSTNALLPRVRRAARHGPGTTPIGRAKSRWIYWADAVPRHPRSDTRGDEQVSVGTGTTHAPRNPTAARPAAGLLVLERAAGV